MSVSAVDSSSNNLSAVGESLLTNGSAPVATPASSTTSTSSSSSTISPYQAEYLTLQQQDTAELLYASFLSPSDSLANTDSVLSQAAQLLGTPGSLATSQSTTTSGASTSTSTNSSSSTSSTSTSDTSDPLDNLPSVSSILAASDAEAQATLTAYGNAPTGSSIIDYQA